MPEEIDIYQPAGPRRPGPAVQRDPPVEIPLFPPWLLADAQWSDTGYWVDKSKWQDAA